jgi:DNA replication protein DnaC
MRGDGGAGMSAVADVRPALIGHLKDLHLPTVRECYEETARRAERETLSYEQYLLEVMARECEQRRKSKVQRLLKDSALPLEKSLQNFNLKRLPAKAARQLRTLLEGGFLDRKRKRSGVRQSWVGEESSFKRAGPGTGSGGGA